MKVFQYLGKITKDKWEHYAVALTLTCLFDIFLQTWLAAIVVLAISIGKEVYDKVSGKGTPDWYDLLADVLGIAIGIM